MKINIKKYIPVLLLITILALGFLLGSAMILHGDYFYLSDQARDYLLTKNIIYGKHLTLIGTHSGLGGFFHGPLWLYMLVPVYLLGKGNPFTFTGFYVLIALVTVGGGYIVGNKLYGKWIGLLIAFILAISASIWPYVPNTIGINMIPVVYLGIFYFLIRFIRGNNKALIFASFLVGITLQFETAAALVLIPTFVFTVLVFRLDILRKWKILIISLVSFIVSISSFILFDFKHQFLMLRSLTSVTQQTGATGYLQLPERIVSHAYSLEGVITSVVFNNNPVGIILLAVILVLGIISVGGQKEKRKELLVYVVVPLLMFIFLTAYPNVIYHDYVLGLTIPIALLFGLCSFSLWKKRFGKILVILFILVNTLFAFQYLFTQYFRYIPDKTAGSYKNQLSVVNWIFKNAGNNHFGYFVYSPDTFTYGMDYLLSWQGERRNTIPKNQKETITYLIMAPPLTGDQSAHVFWKKNTIHTSAKVAERKNFVGDVVVEKLDMSHDKLPVDPNYYQNLIFR